jgi:hypothetical protein
MSSEPYKNLDDQNEVHTDICASGLPPGKTREVGDHLEQRSEVQSVVEKFGASDISKIAVDSTR